MGVSAMTQDWNKIFEQVNELVLKAQTRYSEYQEIFDYCREVIKQHAQDVEFWDESCNYLYLNFMELLEFNAEVGKQ